jgi:hypothetical protein
VCLSTAGVARAHPADILRDPFFDLRTHQKGRMRPARVLTPEEICDRNKSWARLVACLKKGGNSVSMLYDVAGARVVAVKGNPSYGSASVYIYAQKSGRWQRMSGYFSTSPTSEMLGFSRLKNGNGYRLEQGAIDRTSAFIGQVLPGRDPTRVAVTVRRTLTSICLDNGSCQTLVTSCDGLVDGNARWSFRATLLIDHGAVRISGDKTYAGPVCTPAASQLSNVGDPLE